MNLSGRVRDCHFAAGFLAALAAQTTVTVATGQEYWRPCADLGSPFGRIEGDIGCLVGSNLPLTPLLVIVEREGSAPGNERNILKWFEAMRTRTPIRLVLEQQSHVVQVQDVLLIMAFCPSAAWQGSDFAKTVAFCTTLADLINTGTSPTIPRLKVLVEQQVSSVDDWRASGAALGAKAGKWIQTITSNVTQNQQEFDLLPPCEEKGHA